MKVFCVYCESELETNLSYCYVCKKDKPKPLKKHNTSIYSVFQVNGEYQFFKGCKNGEGYLGLVETDFPVVYPLRTIDTGKVLFSTGTVAKSIEPLKKPSKKAKIKKRRILHHYRQPEKIVEIPASDGFPEFKKQKDIFPDDFPDFPKVERSIRDYVVMG